MALIKWQTHAKKHVREVFDYYKEHASLAVANSLRSAIVDGVDILEKFPLSGKVDTELSTPDITYYYIIVKKGKRTYRDYYIYNEKKDICYILAIWDCSMNPAQLQSRIIPIKIK